MKFGNAIYNEKDRQQSCKHKVSWPFITIELLARLVLLAFTPYCSYPLTIYKCISQLGLPQRRSNTPIAIHKG